MTDLGVVCKDNAASVCACLRHLIKSHKFAMTMALLVTMLQRKRNLVLKLLGPNSTLTNLIFGWWVAGMLYF